MISISLSVYLRALWLFVFSLSLVTKPFFTCFFPLWYSICISLLLLLLLLHPFYTELLFSLCCFINFPQLCEKKYKHKSIFFLQPWRRCSFVLTGSYIYLFGTFCYLKQHISHLPFGPLQLSAYILIFFQYRVRAH